MVLTRLVGTMGVFEQLEVTPRRRLLPVQHPRTRPFERAGGVLLLQGVPVTQWPMAARSAYAQAPGLFDAVLQHAGWCVLTLPTGPPPKRSDRR